MKHEQRSRSATTHTHIQLNIWKQCQVEEFASRAHCGLFCGARMERNKSQELRQHGCILISILPVGWLWPDWRVCCGCVWAQGLPSLLGVAHRQRWARVCWVRFQNAEVAVGVNCLGGRLNRGDVSPPSMSCCWASELWEERVQQTCSAASLHNGS